ncbi:MAG TPA: gamma-glutamyltransferase [Longimicrobiales bacterium]|nr:gamma-glutamyltransferase [Longimicrobiales bacterium]
MRIRPRPLALAAFLLLGACAPAGPPRASAPASADAVLPPGVVEAVAPASAPARSDRGMVVSAHVLASRIGDEVLRKGGNAVDAAIATGFALAVVYPTAGNIGGGGFMVLRFPDGRVTALDFREKAPLAAHPEMWLDSAGRYDEERHHFSHMAVGVPGTVAGFALAHQRYGSLPWADVVEPAVRLATDGFIMTPELAASLRAILPDLRRYPASVAAYSRNGVPWEAGDTVRFPDLGRTLARIRDQGRAGFYAGETARLLVAEMERGGGLITLADLRRYRPEEREPIRGTYRGYGVISMPPPSSGGVALVEMLNILEGYDLGAMGHNSAPYVHHLVEAMRRAYRDRAAFVADPGFTEVPVRRLTSKEYAAGLRREIRPSEATPSLPADLEPRLEGDQTTHYSIVDEDGLAVATTFTLEYGYGSRIVVDGAGFLLNNQMGDFNAAPGLTTADGLIGTEPNLARPEQRPISSMTPTILTRPDGDLFAVLGTVGGRTIINLVLQVALNLVDFDMDVVDAVSAPRFHHQWLPDNIRMEPAFRGDPLLDDLARRGHAYRFTTPWGGVHTIRLAPDGSRLGAPDPRNEDGAAVGH